MTLDNMRIAEWLDDLCVRFIINLPREELESIPRICFQIEEAHWFYEDFIRPLDPSLPSMNLRRFSLLMFQHCPLFAGFEQLHAQAYDSFMAYKTRVPVRGAIMLNHDMTHAVLVKGWKKQAKWSFPRGKINKDEPDLDCAVREVYEETGYDLREAGLVRQDEDMKKITVNMREQEMTLYVFRGVPKETYFEPRTRKEISKIDWYKLTDLPAGKRKAQVQQQAAGQDLIKENNFYMVAPFLAPLKAWIKGQNRLDKQKAKARARAGAPVAPAVTDTEEAEPDFGETTADEAPIPNVQDVDGNFADLVAGLGRNHRASDALPEVSVEPTPQVIDPAEQLKRLLSVGSGGSGLPLQTPPVQPSHAHGPPQSNPLLAMLQGNNQPSAPYPHTPVQQFAFPPPQPHSPHGQHHPRPPHLDQLPPPPPFPFQPRHGPQFSGPQIGSHPHGPPPYPPNGFPPQIPPQFLPPPPHQQNPVFPTHAPSIQATFNEQGQRPYQRTGDPEFAQAPQFPGLHGPAIPPASKLPLPKLTAHSLGLLNAFKAQENPTPAPTEPSTHPISSAQPTPHPQDLPLFPRHQHSFTTQQSIPSAVPYAPSPPTFQSPPANASFQPVQPKPTSAAHQASLLNLFRSPTLSAATPPPPVQKGLEPAELSAMPHTPGHVRLPSVSNEPGPPKPDLRVKPSLVDSFGQPLGKPDLTSATISGPVNVPDFDTVKKSTLPGDHSGNSRGPSPAHPKQPPKKQFIPQQILKRDPGRSRASPVEKPSTPKPISPSPKTSPKTTSTVTTPQALPFRPQILKRPQQNRSPAPAPVPAPAPNKIPAHQPTNILSNPPAQAPAIPGPAHHTAAPPINQSFDRREQLPADQKNALLSLFNKAAQPTVSPARTAASPIPPQGLPNPPSGLPTLPSKTTHPRSPIPHTRSPLPAQPPTPKSVVSGVISPVSPLPAGSAQNSPANLASRSRISSIGDTMPPSVTIPKELIPTSDPSTAIHTSARNGFGVGGLEEGYASTGSTGGLGEVVLGKGKAKAKATVATNGDGKSPVDKTFLLGFLQDVARHAR